MKKVWPIDGELNFNYLNDEKNGWVLLLLTNNLHTCFVFVLNIRLEIDISLIWRTLMNSKLNGLRVHLLCEEGSSKLSFCGCKQFSCRGDSHIVVCNAKPNIEMFPMKSNSEWTKFGWNESRKLLTWFLHCRFASRMLHFQVCSLDSHWSLRFWHLSYNVVFWV
jgi:hypothetical protein